MISQSNMIGLRGDGLFTPGEQTFSWD